MNTYYIPVTTLLAYSDEPNIPGPCLLLQNPGLKLSGREPPSLKYHQPLGDHFSYSDLSLGLGASLSYRWTRAGARAMFYLSGLTRY